jgi:hypothetical protein
MHGRQLCKVTLGGSSRNDDTVVHASLLVYDFIVPGSKEAGQMFEREHKRSPKKLKGIGSEYVLLLLGTGSNACM